MKQKTNRLMRGLCIFLACFFFFAPAVPFVQAEEEQAPEEVFGKRLLVCTEEEEIFSASDPVIGSYEGVYLLQYESEEEAKKAYKRFDRTADAVEMDRGFQTAEEESEEDFASETISTEEENPFAELEEAVRETKKERYDIALIDTGADGADAAVSVIGDNTSDENGHGNDMLALIREQNPNARVLSVKALDAEGIGDTSSVYAALQYAMSQEVSIINLSVSAYASSDSVLIEEAVKEASEKGIEVVGSAGNHGKNAKYFIPGRIAEAWILGACDEEGVKRASSNYGDSVDYNIAASSTSEAAALFSGFLSANAAGEINGDVLNQGFLFETDYKKETEDVAGESLHSDKKKRVILQYLFVNPSMINGEETIDEIMADKPESVVFSMETLAPLREEGDCYTALIHAPILTGMAEENIMDVIFAKGNNEGQVIEGSYDPESYRVSIPKKEVKTEGDDFADAQIEVMLPYRGSDTSISVRIDNHSRSVQTVPDHILNVNAFDEEVVLDIVEEGSISDGNVIVRLNGESGYFNHIKTEDNRIIITDIPTGFIYQIDVEIGDEDFRTQTESSVPGGRARIYNSLSWGALDGAAVISNLPTKAAAYFSPDMDLSVFHENDYYQFYTEYLGTYDTNGWTANKSNYSRLKKAAKENGMTGVDNQPDPATKIGNPARNGLATQKLFVWASLLKGDNEALGRTNTDWDGTYSLEEPPIPLEQTNGVYGGIGLPHTLKDRSDGVITNEFRLYKNKAGTQKWDSISGYSYSSKYNRHIPVTCRHISVPGFSSQMYRYSWKEADKYVPLDSGSYRDLDGDGKRDWDKIRASLTVVDINKVTTDTSVTTDIVFSLQTNILYDSPGQVDEFQTGGSVFKIRQVRERPTYITLKKGYLNNKNQIEDADDIGGAVYAVKNGKGTVAGYYITAKNGVGYLASYAKITDQDKTESYAYRINGKYCYTRTAGKILRLNVGEKYTVEEILAPLNGRYAKNTKSFSFTTGAAGTTIELEPEDHKTILGDWRRAYLKLLKEKAQSDEKHDAYSLAGAVYGVYTDYNCRKPAKDKDGYEVCFMTNSGGIGYTARRIGDNGAAASDFAYLVNNEGESEKYGTNFKQEKKPVFEGTYYVREIVPPRSGRYELDEKVYGPYTVPGGNTVKVKTKDELSPGFPKFKKVAVDGGNVSGALYLMYNYPSGDQVMYKDEDGEWPLGFITNSAGTGYVATTNPNNTGGLSVYYPAQGVTYRNILKTKTVGLPDTVGADGYNYSLKEAVSPDGYIVDTGEYKMNLTATAPGAVEYKWKNKTGQSGDYSVTLTTPEYPEKTGLTLSKTVESPANDTRTFEFDVRFTFPNISSDSSQNENVFHFSRTYEGQVASSGSRDYHLDLRDLAMYGHTYRAEYEWQAYWNDGSVTTPHGVRANAGSVTKDYQISEEGGYTSSSGIDLNPNTAQQEKQQHMWVTGAQTDHRVWHSGYYTGSGDNRVWHPGYYTGGYGHMHNCNICGASYDDYNQSAPGDSTCTRFTTTRYEITGLTITMDPNYTENGGGSFIINSGNGASYTKLAYDHFTVRLKSGQSIYFGGMPNHTQFSIHETDHAGYVLQYSVDGGARIMADPLTGTITETDPMVTQVSAYNNKVSKTIRLTKLSSMLLVTAQFSGDEYENAHRNDVDEEGNPDISPYNNMYAHNCDGAEFRIHIDRPDAAVPDVIAQTKSGTFLKKDIYPGDVVTITEENAPTGYILPEHAEVRFTVTESGFASLSENGAEVRMNGNEISVVFKDEPLLEPSEIPIRKAISRLTNGEWKIADDTAINGAVFRWDYYDNTAKDHAGDIPVRTWYFVSRPDPVNGQQGILKYQSDFVLTEEIAEHIAGSESDKVQLNAYAAVNADNPLFWKYDETNQKKEALPLGSVRITEVWSPAGYKLYEDALSATLTQDPEDSDQVLFEWNDPESSEVKISDASNAVTLADREVVMAINKKDEFTGEDLSGVQFRITDITDGLAEHRETFNTPDFKLPDNALFIVEMETEGSAGSVPAVRKLPQGDGTDPAVYITLRPEIAGTYTEWYAQTDSMTSVTVTYMTCDDVESAKNASVNTLDFTIDNTSLIKEFLQLEHCYVLEETDFADGYVLSEDDVFFHIEDSGEAVFDPSTRIDEEGNLQHYLPDFETVSMDNDGNITEDGSGFDCTLVHIANDPNAVYISKKLLYTETEGDNNMANVKFRVYADGFSGSDWIAELEDGTKICSGYEFKTDAGGNASLYHLRRGHTYHFLEIETWDEKQLLAGTADIRVSQEKGRIIGPENIRKDGNIEYTLTILNHDEINLFTGGEGTRIIYLAGIAAALAGLFLFMRAFVRRRNAGRRRR